ncbi:MAG: nitroreductase family protein [Deltaproteobacteria bacterium]|nr:MAG: nitroreductase family protein [Deltaproteobacteria bacterium]
MISFDQLIADRRSIRKYKAIIPSEDQVMQMIACAAMAPSPSNSQPVRFIRILSGTVKTALQESLEDGYHKLLGSIQGEKNTKRLRNRIHVYKRYSDFIFTAPVLMAIGVIDDYSGFSKILNQAGILEKDFRALIDLDISVGLALKGLILKAETLGMGTCIVSAPLVFIENMEAILGLTGISIRCLLTLGYPDEIPSHMERKNVKEIYQVIS